MLKIRKEQNDELAKVAIKRFVDRVVTHLKKIWPEKCQQMNEAEIRDSIYKAIEQTKRAGIMTEYNVVRYVDMMYVFDWDFDAGPSPLWARQIFENKHLSEHEKMDRLYEHIRQEETE